MDGHLIPGGPASPGTPCGPLTPGSPTEPGSPTVYTQMFYTIYNTVFCSYSVFVQTSHLQFL